MNENLKSFLLKKSDTFCMLPFMHLYANPDGAVLPCCSADSGLPVGNLKMNSISEVWNSAEFKTLRKSLLSEKKIKNCKSCYLHEKSSPNSQSFRKWANNNFQKYIDFIDTVRPDGSMTDVPLRYYDLRWSNVCNFKCRTCGDLFSSSWAKENKKFTSAYTKPIKTHISNHAPEFFEQLKLYLSNIDVFYFAGGEPLITPEHYKILDYLIDNNKTNKFLKYNSNMSTLSFNGKNILQLWDKFEKIEVRASIDSWGSRAEYIRSGTNWDVVLNNMKLVKKTMGNVTLQFNCVVSLMNILTLTEFLDTMIENGLLDIKNDFPSFYRAIYPASLTIRVLDSETKETAQNKLLAWLYKNECSEFIKNQLTDIVAYLNEDHSDLNLFSKKLIDSLDFKRNESFVKVFPELSSWYNKII